MGRKPQTFDVYNMEAFKEYFIGKKGNIKACVLREHILERNGWLKWINENSTIEPEASISEKVFCIYKGYDARRCADCGALLKKSSGKYPERCKPCNTILKNSVDVDREEIKRLYLEEMKSATEISKMDIAIDKKTGRHISNVCIIHIVGKENMRSARECQVVNYSRGLYETNKLNLPLDEIVDKYVNQNKSTGYLASFYNCDVQTIRNQLKRLGIQLRETNVSKEEESIREFLTSLGVGYEKNIRSLIPGYRELDIVIPEHKLAIEVNGVFWHSDKEKYYHLKKTKDCEDVGYQLLHFTDLTIKNNFDIVCSIIKNKLKLNDRVYARNTIFKEVSKEEQIEFFSENHISGYHQAKIAYGLYDSDGGELLMCASFSAPRFNKKYQWEIIRLATKKEITVVGGLDKLIKNFGEQHSGSIITYARLDLGTGEGYLNAGFTRLSDTDVDYIYFSLKDGTSKSRFQCMKHKLVDKYPEYKDLTEHEIMKKLGYVRYYGCGNAVYVLN